jgi:hypothetical protein
MKLRKKNRIKSKETEGGCKYKLMGENSRRKIGPVPTGEGPGADKQKNVRGDLGRPIRSDSHDEILVLGIVAA